MVAPERSTGETKTETTAGRFQRASVVSVTAENMAIGERPKWWKNAVVYQIYPASFKDSNGDGLGDLPGIIAQLDYIRSLGVDTIWICPMYDSPQYDMGYDISDYRKVYPPYGTNEDMERLIEGCHERGMRIILDLVINHTSHQHAWFQESRLSKDNPKRDWYIWRPARYVDGVRKPPNNWKSNFGGSAWTWDDNTQEYYLHLFCPEQPDLNWENDETRQAIYQDAMIFWLEKGVDGFRVDTVNMYSKTHDMPDAPVTEPDSEWQFAGFEYCNGPRMHEFLSEMNAILARYDAMTVGELPNTPDPTDVLSYVSAKAKQLDMVFQFDVVDLGQGAPKYQTTPFNWTLPDFKAAVSRTQDITRGTDGWSTAFLENHDQARSISRFASDLPEHRVASGKMLALLLATLSGTLFVYQGQELGMINFPLDWSRDEYMDVDSKNHFQLIADRTNEDPEAMRAAQMSLQHLARDHARVPMQWDASPNAGFTCGRPWMRVNDDYKTCNAKQQLADKTSVFHFWQRVLALRREHADLFVHGVFDAVAIQDSQTFTYTKTCEDTGRKLLVILNFSDTTQAVAAASQDLTAAKLLLSTYEGTTSLGADLAAFEGRAYLL